MLPVLGLFIAFLQSSDRPPASQPATPAVREFTLPDLELTRAGVVRGRVVDEAGRAVAGATITATWIVYNGSTRSASMGTVTSDASGSFVVEGVATDVEVRLVASYGPARTAASVSTVPSNAELVTLKISAASTAALRGRVVDPGGKPVPGAAIKVITRERSAEGWISSMGPVRFEQQTHFKTDDQGKYLTPRQLAATGEYRVLVQGEELMPAASEWIVMTGPGQKAVPDLVAVRRRTVTGTVVDRTGKPVAGAKVFHAGLFPKRGVGTTDKDGSFKLEHLAGGDAFVFVDADGFQFQGRRVAATESNCRITLSRNDEKPAERMATRTGPVSQSQAEEVAMRLIQPELDRAIKDDSTKDKLHAIGTVAAFSPRRAEGLLEKHELSSSINDSLREQMARGLMRDGQFDEAMSLIESIENTQVRAQAFRDAYGATAPARRPELLTAAAIHARSVDDPAWRVCYLTTCADRLLDMGRSNDARQVLEQIAPVMQELPRTGLGGYARASFAVAQARIELPAALKLLETGSQQDEYEQVRYFGPIAIRLADSNPAEAERVFKLAFNPRYMMDHGSAGVAWRMAGVDPERARRIIDMDSQSGQPQGKSYAMGVLALAMAERDKAASRQLIDEAFTSLTSRVERGADYFNNRNCCASIAAAMLPFVEAIDPDHLPGYFWKSLAMRLADRDGLGSDESVFADAGLAMMLSRYDHEVARTLFAPIARRAGALTGPDIPGDPAVIWTAAALIDPVMVAHMIESLPDDTPDERKARSARARTIAIRVLTAGREKRWDSAYAQIGLWRPGSDDRDF